MRVGAEQRPPPGPGARRVLVLSASMGAGHDGAARELASRLRGRGHDVEIHDYLPLIPLWLGFAIRWLYGLQLRVAPSSYQWHYAHCERPGPVLTISLWFARLARRRVRRLVRRVDADLVVSTYPLASQVLGTLRAEGRLRTPTATYLTDFSPHNLWVHPHVDLHLCVSGATARAATALCARPAVGAGPLVPDAFSVIRNARGEDRAAVRARLRVELGLAPTDVVALTVAGSWGVGDVRTTVERLAAGARVRPVVVCGRNAELRAELASVPGAVALGWRTDMPDLMRAADVLVENAGGLTAMEAFASGLPVISHECIAGHGRDNAAVMAAQGVARWVTEPAELVPTVLALAGPAGRGQAARAARIFAADPAAVVATLAQTHRVADAVAAAGLPPLAPVPLAPSSRRVRLRRGARRSSVALGAVALLSTVGVSTATALGVGVSSGQTHHRDAVYVVVRLATHDLDAEGRLPDGLATALRGAGATVAVDQRLLRQDAPGLHTLADQGLTLVNAGAGHGASLDPRTPTRDQIGPRASLSRLPGAVPWIFVACRSLNALDLITSTVGEDVLVPPDDVVRAAGPLRLRGGRVVLVDGRALSEPELEGVLRSARSSAVAGHLALRPITGLVARPR